METPNKKFFCDSYILKSIDGPNKFPSKPYPMPSNFYVDVLFSGHSCRFGYQSMQEAKEDAEFLSSLIK